jgi:hypothetical protein
MMPLNSIEQERLRVMGVVCPRCLAAPNQLCTQKYYNSAGVQTKETNIFHAERVVKAQTLAERALDTCKQIQQYLDTKEEIKRDRSLG